MSRAPAGSLDQTQKGLTLLLIAFGLYTFFLPMVKLDPPLMGRREWSALDIGLSIYHRTLPAHGGMVDWGPGGLLDIGVLYLLMAFCAVALYFPGPPRVLRVLSMIGFVISFEAKWWDSAFHLLFGYYGHLTQWQMARGLAWWTLPWIMPALLCLNFRARPNSPDNPQDVAEF